MINSLTSSVDELLKLLLIIVDSLVLKTFKLRLLETLDRKNERHISTN